MVGNNSRLVYIYLLTGFGLGTGWQRGGALGFRLSKEFFFYLSGLMHLDFVRMWLHIFLLILGVSPCFELLSVLMTADLLHGMGFFFFFFCQVC